MTTQDWTVSGGLPPDLSMEQDRLRRQRQVAEAMLSRGLSPVQAPQGGRYVVPISPLAPLAQMFQVYAGKEGVEKSDAGMKDISGRYNEGLAEAVKRYTEGGSRQVEAPTMEGMTGSLDEQDMPRKTETVKADPRTRVAEAMASPYAPVRQLAQLDYQQSFKAAESKEAREARLHERILALDAAAQNQALAREERAARAAEAAQLRRELAAQSDATRREIAGFADAARQQKNVPKLPGPALKLQQEELEAIGIAQSLNADLGAIEKQIAEGKLNPSLIGNAINNMKNALGLSDKESRNLASFKATLEKMRNDSLRLNKGVQTEGDAVRAWNELVANINDKGVVTQRLGEIRKLNERAANLRRNNIDVIRANFGLDPMDISAYQNQPAAVGTGATQTFVAPGTQMPASGADPNDPLGLRRPR